MLLAGFIPGPNNPKDLDSFVFPLVREFLHLGSGVPDVWMCGTVPGTAVLPSKLIFVWSLRICQAEKI